MNTKFDRFFNKVGGRFTTLTLREGRDNKDYCAKFVNASPRYITFNDVSTNEDRKVSLDQSCMRVVVLHGTGHNCPS